jgi:hypothetical protein
MGPFFQPEIKKIRNGFRHARSAERTGRHAGGDFGSLPFLSRLLLGHLFPVFQKSLDALVRQGMLPQRREQGAGDRRDVRPQNRRLLHVLDIPDAGHDDLRLKPVMVLDGFQIADQLHAVRSDVVDSADKRTDVCDILPSLLLRPPLVGTLERRFFFARYLMLD